MEKTTRIKSGSTIGEYQIVSRLSIRRPIVTYTALNTKTQTNVVVKKLPKTLSRRASENIKLLKEINHDNIVKTLDLINYDDDQYIIYEYYYKDHLLL